MSKMSKEKGKRGEREVAALLREHGYVARRGQQFSGGQGSPDVVHDIPRLHIEVKYRERFSLYEAMDQTRSDSGPLELPVVFHRRKNKPWLVSMNAEDFLRLVKGLQAS